jgi:hypothetical protein
MHVEASDSRCCYGHASPEQLHGPSIQVRSGASVEHPPLVHKRACTDVLHSFIHEQSNVRDSPGMTPLAYTAINMHDLQCTAHVPLPFRLQGAFFVNTHGSLLCMASHDCPIAAVPDDRQTDTSSLAALHAATPQAQMPMAPRMRWRDCQTMPTTLPMTTPLPRLAMRLKSPARPLS